MPLLYQRTLICPKVETVRGTDANAEGSDAVILTEASVKQLDAEILERNFFTGNTFSNPAKVTAASYFGLTGKHELAGSGTAGVAPKWGRLLRGCGLEETITPATNTIYKPRYRDFESLTIRAFFDGVESRGLGCVATGKIMFNAGELSMLELEAMGTYLEPTDIAVPTEIVSEFQTPLAVNAGNTSLVLHGETLVAKSFELDFGTVVEKRDMVGSNECYIANSRPVGKVSFEMTKVESKNWTRIARDSVEGAMMLTHGSDAGHIISILADNVSLSNPELSDDQGVYFLSVDLNFALNANAEPYQIVVM